MIPLVDLKRQYQSIKPEIDTAIDRVLSSTSFIMGDEVENFEKLYAHYLGRKRCVSLASGTAAIGLAVRAAGIGPGDEVITTPHTFIATAEAVSHVGAAIRFVDVEEETGNIDPELVRKAITRKTKAIIPVHLYGHPCDMKPLEEVASKHNLHIIEDAAQAHDTRYRGKRIPYTKTGTFSFFPAKTLGAYGDAGALVTDDENLAAQVSLLRDHGRIDKYNSSILGFGERMDALQAAILAVKLKHLDRWVDARRERAARYTRELQGVTAPVEKEYARHSYYMYVVRSEKRDDLMQHLKREGISSGIHYPVPLNRQPVYAGMGTYPIAEKLANEILSLPLFPELTAEEQTVVINAVNLFSK